MSGTEKNIPLVFTASETIYATGSTPFRANGVATWVANGIAGVVLFFAAERGSCIAFASVQEPMWGSYSQTSTLVLSPKSAKRACLFGRTDDEVEKEFSALLEQWNEDTLGSSKISQVVFHPAYMSIIGLGWQVIPHILTDMVNGGGPWLPALDALVPSDLRPAMIGHERDARLMRADWIAWGKMNGLIAG